MLHKLCRNLRNYAHAKVETSSKNLVPAFASLMRDCSVSLDLNSARHIQCEIDLCGLNTNIQLGNQLVQLFIKCGSLQDARSVFDKMPSRGRLAWTSVISAYTQLSEFDEAYLLFRSLLQEGEVPDSVTFVTILTACTCLVRANAVHSLISECGLEQHPIVANALMSMYTKQNLLQQCEEVFSNVSERNVVSWTVMITAYAQEGHFNKSLWLFGVMQLNGWKPNVVTFNTVLGLFTTPEHLSMGKSLHMQLLSSGIDIDIALSNTVVKMYASCGDLGSAVCYFKSMSQKESVSWNVMINAYAEHGRVSETVQLFRKMQLEGMKLQRATYLSILNAGITSLRSFEEICACIRASGYESNLQVGNSLLTLHGKLSSVETAREMFWRMPQRDVVSWTSMINTLSENHLYEDALYTFRRMLWEGICPNQVTFLAVLNSCRCLTDGLCVHSVASDCKLTHEVDIGSALVEMYSRCGDLMRAKEAFGDVRAKNLVLWNVLISGTARNACFVKALRLFWLMQQDGEVRPHEITLNAVLSTCAHAGFVSRGCMYFASMKSDYGLASNPRHYSCLVDLLGRAGRLDEAERVMSSMSYPANESVRMAFLGACRTHCDKERGKRAAERLLQLEPFDHSVYVTLSHLHAEQESSVL